MATQKYVQHPDSELDYYFDWSDWLEDGETITSFDVSGETGITVYDTSLTGANSVVEAWLRDGVLGQSYRVTCSIITSNDRHDARYIAVRIRAR